MQSYSLFTRNGNLLSRGTHLSSPPVPTSSLLLQGASGGGFRVVHEVSGAPPDQPHRRADRAPRAPSPWPAISSSTKLLWSPTFLPLRLHPLAPPWPSASELRRQPPCLHPTTRKPHQKAPPQLPLASTRSSALLAQGRRRISSFSVELACRPP